MRRALLKDRGISTQRACGWDAIAYHHYHRCHKGLSVMTIQESRWTSSVRVLIDPADRQRGPR